MVHEPVIKPTLYPGVTVSSTFSDLQKHRLALFAAIGQSSLKPVCMEDDAAKVEDVIDASLQKVRDGSAYIGIIAHRYGQTPECPRRNPKRLSITELEFDEAVRLKRPILLFLMADDHPLVKADVESDPEKQRQLHAFRERAKQMGPDSKVHRVYAVFHSVEDFRDKASRSLRELHALLRPAVASTAVVAADGPPQIPVPPRRYAVPPYMGSHDFQGRTDELATLGDWSAPADPHPVLLFEAIGGTGKSMLTWHWVTQNAPALRDDWAGVFWYSFYERGAVLTDFCGHALAYMTQAPLDSFRAVAMPELADRLLRQLQARPWLLVLDGLERVLVAYHRHDAAQVPDQEAGTGDAIGHRDPCQAIRPEDDDLLRKLATAAPSKLLLTTRLTPRVLLNAARMPVPGVRRVFLQGLRPADAEKLLRACGVSGTSQKIQEYLQRHCDCHPLVTGVVAGLVNDYLPARGDLDAWADDPFGGGQLDLAALNLAQKRNHILNAAFDALPADGRQLLSTLALVSEAVDYETLRALSPHRARSEEDADRVPTRQRLKEDRPAGRSEESLLEARALAATVLDLERRGLLQYDHQEKRYDLHPVVRGVAAGGLANQDRQILGQRVVDHFSQRPHSPYREAESLEDVSAGLQVVRVLLQMGRHEQAFDAYINGLGEAIKINLDAHCETLALLRPFFGPSWTDLPTGLASWQLSWVARDAAHALYHTHQYEDSLAVFQAVIVNEDNLPSLVGTLLGIEYVLCAQGKLALATRCGELGFELGDLSDNPREIFRTRLMRLITLAAKGEWEDADAVWQALCAVRSKRGVSMVDIDVADFVHLECEFWRGRLEESELRRAEGCAAASRNRKARANLHWLRGLWMATQGDWHAAVRSLNEAVWMMREVGARNVNAEARLALAKFRIGQLPEPRQHAEELSQVNDPVHSVLAELWQALGDDERARHHALAAYREAWADGVPHVFRYALDRAGALLERLGVEVPVLPAYDPSKAETLPFEDVVVAYIEKLRAERAAAGAAEDPDAPAGAPHPRRPTAEPWFSR